MAMILENEQVAGVPNSGWQKTEQDVRENRFLGDRFRENQSRPGVRAFAACQRCQRVSASRNG